MMMRSDAEVHARHLPWEEKLDKAFFRWADRCLSVSGIEAKVAFQTRECNRLYQAGLVVPLPYT